MPHGLVSGDLDGFVRRVTDDHRMEGGVCEEIGCIDGWEEVKEVILVFGDARVIHRDRRRLFRWDKDVVGYMNTDTLPFGSGGRDHGNGDVA